jgi:WD40 repeat protein
LLTSSSDKTARIWDIQTCRVEKIFIGHKLSVTSAVFSPKDNVVLTCSEDKTACLWDINTGDKTITLSGHDRKINVANFSPDGTKILTGSSDGTAKLWDATSGKEIRTFYEYSPHSTSVYAIAFYGSTKILTGDKSNRLVLWDIDTGKQIQHFSGGIIGSRGYMSNPINSIAVQDGFVLTAEAGISKYWSIEKAELFDIFMGHSKTVSSVDLAESWALTGSHDNSAILWRKRYCDFLNKTVILKGHDDAITCVRFSRNEEKLATASFDKTVKIWDINLYTLNTGPLNLPHKEYYSAYEFSLPDLVNKGLQIEPEDVPQYIKEIFHSSQVEGFNKDNAFNNAKLYIKDSSLLEKIKRDLGLLNDA